MPPPPSPYLDVLPQLASRTAASAELFWRPGPEQVRPGHRVRAAAELAWRETYPTAYAYAYDTVTHQAGAALRELHETLLAAGPARGHDANAVHVFAEITPSMKVGTDLDEPMPSDVIPIAVRAVRNRGGLATPAQAATMAVHRSAAWTAGISGASAAARDLDATWHLMAGTEDLTTQQVHERLAALQTSFINDWMSRDHLPTGAATLAKASFTRPTATAAPTRTSAAATPRRRFTVRHWRRP